MTARVKLMLEGRVISGSQAASLERAGKRRTPLKPRRTKRATNYIGRLEAKEENS